MLTVEAEAARRPILDDATLVNASGSISTESVSTETTQIEVKDAIVVHEKRIGQPINEKSASSNFEQRDLEAQISSATPAPLASPTYARLRYAIFTIYRRLFSIVFLANLAVFIAVVIRNRTLTTYVNASAANLLGVGLARQPLVVNLLFRCLCWIPRSAPLRIRRLAAKVFHYGGVHSGCGVSAVMWYIGFIVFLSREAATNWKANQVSPAILVFSYLILFLLLAIMIAAYPAIRFKRHDYFEFTHRFSGWLAIALFWPLLLLFAQKEKLIEHKSYANTLVAIPAFWILILLTMSIIQPWLYLRKVPVVAEPISQHAIRLHFDFTTIRFGKAFAISKHPLRDWHGFAQFMDIDGDHKFSCLVSKAGDWTSDCIARPPTHVWKRGVPVFGFGYCMKMFRSFLMVTTGSGIGPCLSFLALKDRPPLRMIWQTKSPIKTYGQGIMDSVKVLDPNPVILDTSKTGRQDMLPIVLDMVEKFGPEAVLVVSNPMFTRKMVFDLEARGIPAYGPIFDS